MPAGDLRKQLQNLVCNSATFVYWSVSYFWSLSLPERLCNPGLTLGTSLLQQRVCHHFSALASHTSLPDPLCFTGFCRRMWSLWCTLSDLAGSTCTKENGDKKRLLWYFFFPALIQSYLCDLVPNIVFGFLIILRRGVAEATRIRHMTLITALSQPICTFGL